MTASDQTTLPGVIFIGGLGHSGSTLLDMLLGGHEQVVSLGEVYAHLRPDKDRRARRELPCTCGLELSDCELWGPIRARCEDPRTPLEGKYRALLTRCAELYGPGTRVVDSSNKAVALAALAQVTADLTVIHLVRDVRSWSVSRIDGVAERRAAQEVLRGESGAATSGRRGAVSPRWGVAGKLGTVVQGKAGAVLGWRRFRLWYRENQRFLQEVEALGLPFTRVGYEPLAMAPRLVLEKLCAQLGLEFSESMLVPSASKGHLVRGNEMRFSAAKKRDVVYSTRWLTRTEWVIPSLLCRPTMRANADWVYGGLDNPVDS